MAPSPSKAPLPRAIVDAPRAIVDAPRAIVDVPDAERREAGTLEDFFTAFQSRFWFTYRRDMPRLAPSILTSDAGFGCMVRAGQSLMAEALARVALGPSWSLPAVLGGDEATLAAYKGVVRLFLDVPSAAAPFSLPNLVAAGSQLGVPIGQFFTPTILTRALRRQAASVPALGVHHVRQGVIEREAIAARMAAGKPQLLLVPMRLGTDVLNEAYGALIRAALASPLSVGIVGGRPSRAFYIVGFQEAALLFLDPHILQPALLDVDQSVARGECHTERVCEMALCELDPTLLFGFLCQTPADLAELCSLLHSAPSPMPLFSFV